MDMVARRKAGDAGSPHGLPRLYLVPRLDPEFTEMGVQSHESQPVIDHCNIAVNAEFLRKNHPSGIGGGHFGAGHGSEIQTGMNLMIYFLASGGIGAGVPEVGLDG